MLRVYVSQKQANACPEYYPQQQALYTLNIHPIARQINVKCTLKAYPPAIM